MTAGKKWFALYTRSRWEKKVHGELLAMGIETYLPLVKTLRQWSDRKKMVEEPLFRSYVFVCITPTEHDLAIKVPGVVRYVTFRGRAVAIPEQEIEAVKAYVGEGDDRTSRLEEYSIGDPVEVKMGVMRGLRGTLVKVRGKSRVLVEVESIGEKIILNLPSRYLNPLH